MRVLVVEDSTLANFIICEHLKSLGHEVVSVMDGFQALKYAVEPFDLMMLDISLPRLNGVRLAKIIRGIETRRNIIVAITAETDFINEHFDAIYNKPVFKTDIIRILRLKDEKEINDTRSSRTLRSMQTTNSI